MDTGKEKLSGESPELSRYEQLSSGIAGELNSLGEALEKDADLLMRSPAGPALQKIKEFLSDPKHLAPIAVGLGAGVGSALWQTFSNEPFPGHTPESLGVGMSAVGALSARLGVEVVAKIKNAIDKHE